jgi:hypothetical protein
MKSLEEMREWLKRQRKMVVSTLELTRLDGSRYDLEEKIQSSYVENMSGIESLNLERVMQNQGLIIEVLLDIRDLLSEKGKAQLCPVCLGCGKTPCGLGQTGTVPLERTCHGCDGKGWVSVPGEIEG